MRRQQVWQAVTLKPFMDNEFDIALKELALATSSLPPIMQQALLPAAVADFQCRFVLESTIKILKQQDQLPRLKDWAHHLRAILPTLLDESLRSETDEFIQFVLIGEADDADAIERIYEKKKAITDGAGQYSSRYARVLKCRPRNCPGPFDWAGSQGCRRVHRPGQAPHWPATQVATDKIVSVRSLPRCFPTGVLVMEAVDSSMESIGTDKTTATMLKALTKAETGFP